MLIGTSVPHVASAGVKSRDQMNARSSEVMN